MRKGLASLSIIAGLALPMVASPTTAVGGKSSLEVRDATCSSRVHHFDFGSVSPPNASSGSFCVFVVGDSPASNVQSAISGDGAFSFIVHNCGGGTLNPGGDCMDEIRFAPSSTGHFHATYTVTAADGSSAKVGLAGTGV